VSEFTPALTSGEVVQEGPLTDRIAAALSAGYCVVHGANKLLARHRLDVRADRQVAYDLYESLFRSALGQIDLVRYRVTDRPMTVRHMDFDGFNLNSGFSHDGGLPPREFMTAKCIHFDCATPFVANIYGPNENIGSGLPLICDVQRYCRDRGVAPASLVEPIPNNYTVNVKREHYAELLRNYSFAYQQDLTNDIVVVMIMNEIEFGFAHGATDPYPLDRRLPSRRPLRHIEQQYLEEPHYQEWYDYYELPFTLATDYQGENLSLGYFEPAELPLENIIPVA
jgi:hypothetical protein